MLFRYAETLDCVPGDVELADGHARIVGVPEKAIAIKRVAASAHWHPAGLPENMEPGIHETAIVTPPSLAAPDAEDRVASALTYGSVFDLAAVEIERDSGRVRIETYVSVHDVGTMLNPLIVEGQIRGGFAHGLGAALMEELAYDGDGNFLSGSFADYLCPTANDMPPIEIGHITTPSPVTELGAKGMGDGSSMLAPAAIANAVADALGRDDIALPLRLDRVWRLARKAAT